MNSICHPSLTFADWVHLGALIVSVVALIVSALAVRNSNKLNERTLKHAEMLRKRYLAGVWSGVMTELRHSLGRLKTTVARLDKDIESISSFKIELVDGLCAEFMKNSNLPEVSKTIYEIYNNVALFRVNYNDWERAYYEFMRYKDSLTMTQDQFDKMYLSLGGMAEIGGRYEKMRKDFESCLEQLNRFVTDNRIGEKLDLEPLEEYKISNFNEDILPLMLSSYRYPDYLINNLKSRGTSY